MQNENPQVYDKSKEETEYDYDELIKDEISVEEIFDLIRNINDPEHPLSLEQLKVVQLPLIKIAMNVITIEFTPTIPHCSMATLIGLSIRVQLLRCVSSAYKVCIRVSEGSHVSERGVNKQLNDKERVRAALENGHLLSVVNQCLANAVY